MLFPDRVEHKSSHFRCGRGRIASWRCNVCVAGMPVRAEAYMTLVSAASPLPFPAVVAQGTADPFYPWGSQLVASYVSPELVEFDEGHRFPHDRRANARLAEGIRRKLGLRSAESQTQSAVA